MGCPETKGGDGEEDMLAGVKGPGAGGGDGYADGIAGEGFDGGFSATVADIAVYEGGETEETLEAPQGYYDFEVGLCRQSVEMVPECYESGDNESDVEMEERFVESTSKDGASL